MPVTRMSDVQEPAHLPNTLTEIPIARTDRNGALTGTADICLVVAPDKVLVRSESAPGTWNICELHRGFAYGPIPLGAPDTWSCGCMSYLTRKDCRHIVAAETAVAILPMFLATHHA